MNGTNKIFFGSIVLAILLLSGCSSLNSTKNDGTYSSGSYSGSPSESSSGLTQKNDIVAQNIKQANIRIKVPTNTLNEKTDMAKDKIRGMGVEIQDISYYEYTDSKQYMLLMRTNPDNFESVTNYLKNIGEVKEISTSNSDVTSQYYDLETRITNKEIELQKLNNLYEKTANISDLLAIEQEVSRVQTELELLKQNKKILGDQINKSTISAVIYEEKPESAQFGSSMEKLGSLFTSAFSFAIIVIVVVVAFLIPIVLVVGIVWSIYRKIMPATKSGPKKSSYKEIPPLS